jgi:hypothetical protein
VLIQSARILSSELALHSLISTRNKRENPKVTNTKRAARKPIFSRYAAAFAMVKSCPFYLLITSLAFYLKHFERA